MEYQYKTKDIRISKENKEKILDEQPCGTTILTLLSFTQKNS